MAQSRTDRLNALIQLYNEGEYAKVVAVLTEQYEQLEPSFEANHLHAAALAKVEEWNRAEIYAEKARAMRPKAIEIHALLFDIHEGKKDRERAKQSLERMISSHPDDSRTVHRMFRYHKMCRNLRAGRECLRKLHAVAATDINVLRLCAMVEPVLLSSEDIAFLEAKEVAGSLKDRIKAAFSLGQYHLSRHDFANAQRHFDQANADVLKGGVSKERFSKIVALWISSPFQRGFFKTKGPITNHSRDVLIIGASRSGKSLLEAAICELCGAQPLGEDHTMSDFIETCPGKEKGKLWRYMTDSPVSAIRDDAKRLDQKLIGISEGIKIHTLPGNIFHLPLLSLWKSDMPIIFMKRRLYDHAISIYLKKFREPHELLCSLEGAVRYVYLYNKLVMHFIRILPNPMAFVSYDGFVRNPEGVMKQVAGFIGADRLDWPRFETALRSNAANDPQFLPPGGMDASTRIVSRFRQMERAFPDYKARIDAAVEKLRQDGADMRLL